MLKAYHEKKPKPELVTLNNKLGLENPTHSESCVGLEAEKEEDNESEVRLGNDQQPYSPLQRGEVPLYSSLRRFPIIWVNLHRWQHRAGRVKQTNQCSAFMLLVLIDVYLVTNMADYMDVNF